MRKTTALLASLVIGAAVCAITTKAQIAGAQDASAQATYRDIEQTLGLVPGFFKQFPQSGIAGAWAEFKSVQLQDGRQVRPVAAHLRTST